MLNRVCLVGRMTKNPELRRTTNGTAVATFTLAVNRTFKTNDGQDADFINCVVWKRTAENVYQYCNKGALVSLDGRIQTRTYENSKKQRVYITEVIGETISFLESKNKRENNQQIAPAATSQNNTAIADHTDTHDELDDSFDSYDIMDEDIQF